MTHRHNNAHAFKGEWVVQAIDHLNEADKPHIIDNLFQEQGLTTAEPTTTEATTSMASTVSTKVYETEDVVATVTAMTEMEIGTEAFVVTTVVNE